MPQYFNNQRDFYEDKINWPYDVVTPATGDVVTLAKVKANIRVEQDDTEEDDLLTDFIGEASDFAQTYIGKTLLTTGFRTTRNGFSDFEHFVHGNDYPIVLRRGPNVVVTAVKYIDVEGVEQTIADTEYVSFRRGDFTILRPVDGSRWPNDVRRQEDTVIIEFTAGYGGPTDIPRDIRGAILRSVAALWDNRGDCDCDCASSLPAASKRVFQSYKRKQVC